MPRPKKCRRLSFDAPVSFYKPQGVPMRQVNVVELKADEFEALSLADHQGLDQEAAAKKMGISRPTFSRIVKSARGAVAKALVTGAALKIQKGKENA